MKKVFSTILVVAILCVFGLLAMASGETKTTEDNKATDTTATVEPESKTEKSDEKMDTKGNLGDYMVEIIGSRMAKDYEGKPVIIVKYAFTNNNSEAKCFSYTIDDKAFQDGIGLNSAFLIDESYDYESDNAIKEIKQGSTIELEKAYILNDTTTAVEIECS